MRRSPISLLALGLVLISLIGLTIAQRGAGGARAGAQATPEPDIELLDSVQVEPAATPALHVLLTRVTLAPGEFIGPHDHSGTSILYVESGTICFNAEDPSGVTFHVKAAASSATPTGGCEPPSAVSDAGSDRASSGPGVLLTAGDSVTQGQTTGHHYGNVGTDPAVVLMAELLTETQLERCTGGCG